MLDAGLRVTEVVRLRLCSIDTISDIVKVRSLKKRKSVKPSKQNRDIPLTGRLRDSLIDYINTLKSAGADDFLFPSSMSESGHLTRRAVSKWVKLATGRRFSPHCLRHTFATRVVSVTKDIRAAQDLLGHEDQRTTEIYCHKTQDQRRGSIRMIEKKKLSRWFKRRRRKNDIIVIDYDEVHCHVGRSKELKKVAELRADKVNTILLGPQGVGKSHILSRVTGDEVLYLDDFKMVKGTMKAIVEEVSKRSTESNPILRESHQNVITKASTQRLVEMSIAMTKKEEYTLVIDDLTDVTKSGVRVLEKLKNHFHIIAGAREVKLAYASMLSNFEKIELAPLSRLDSYHLIQRLSDPYASRIKDFFVFRDHVYEQTSGNPLFMRELIDRLGKKKVIDLDTVREVKHTSALKEIDMSLVLVLGLSSLMIMRYVGSEVGDAGAYRLIGGVFLLFALFARPLLMATKRKFV